MRNIKLIIKFEGTEYHGWQIQKNAVSVQQVLDSAVKSVTGENSVRVTGCGRTDSGVHAEKYVASFKTGASIPAERIPYALNSHLPEDIVCIEAADVPESFDPSGNSVMKKYTYRILNSEIPDPFCRRFVHHVKSRLNIQEMKRAAEKFVGTHDFVGFAASGFTVKTTVRTIFSLKVEKCDKIISIAVTGDGFLYNMVRIIAGTLIFVGMGKIRAEDIPHIIRSRDRNLAGITAPAKGLCLTEVYY